MVCPSPFAPGPTRSVVCIAKVAYENLLFFFLIEWNKTLFKLNWKKQMFNHCIIVSSNHDVSIDQNI